MLLWSNGGQQLFALSAGKAWSSVFQYPATGIRYPQSSASGFGEGLKTGQTMQTSHPCLLLTLGLDPKINGGKRGHGALKHECRLVSQGAASGFRAPKPELALMFRARRVEFLDRREISLAGSSESKTNRNPGGVSGHGIG